ncbi:S-adenosyl-L-methionine-dependent methyltransferase [Trametes coccinea BRFM310]|uniref:S-adenosyl-L-methionine-dependent methyltransferase n=1 Tax=Trametes coccinea (strain BRFM310) TaxID=1353009 RepID=A0A1Y2I787_TRAC3|nr:S-adenosyl-L-methionine-dependent methyltransferase [Trametes coccinea BRFM310]
MSTLASLRALYNTIGGALDDLERAYAAHSLDHPSLDEPYYQVLASDMPYSVAPKANPARVAAETISSTDPEIVRAQSLIAGACGQLAASMRNPFFHVLEVAHLGHISAAAQFLEASHTVEILRDAGEQGLHVKDLAHKIEEIKLGQEGASNPDIDHLDPIKLSHVLRLLATHHLLREVAPNVYANNRFSSSIDSGKSLEQLAVAPEKKYEESNGGAAYIGFSYAWGLTAETLRAASYLREWLLLSAERPKKPATTFNLALNTDENFYAWIERPENSLRLAQVSRSMSAARAIQGGRNITDKTAFPWDTLPQNAVIVDVGGGIGGVSDRPQTVSIAPHVWGDAHKDLFEAGRVSFQAQDFFEPQPSSLTVPNVDSVSHPAAYVLARVLHNWPDAQCAQILKNLRAAAGPDTKLIINDTVLPYACPDSGDSDPSIKQTGPTTASLIPTGSPLLPNMGMATLGGYLLSITMMTLLDARERTLEEFQALTLSAGWKIVSIDRCPPPMPWGYIVAVPV